MIVSREEARAATRWRRGDVVAEGLAVVTANRRDHGAGFFAAIRVGERPPKYFSALDRQAALDQALAFVRSEGIRFVLA